MDQRLLDLLTTVLGDYKELNGGEYSFKSPFKRHRKKKLQIQLDLNSEKFGYWNDWITNNSGKSLFSLFKKIGVSESKLDRLADLIDKPSYYRGHKEDSEEYESVELPPEFIPLWEESSTPEYKHALKHLKDREVTFSDIVKYQIGYCESGEYKNRIVVPSFDDEGNVNYFVARTFFDDFLKYKNPSFPKTKVVGFENLISWNYPVVITEGVFDAIAVKRNALPLFGSRLYDKLLNRFVVNEPPEIIITLDSDAIDKSLKIIEELIKFELNVSIVDLPDGSDPSDLGFDKVWNLIKERDQIDLESFVQYKLFV